MLALGNRGGAGRSGRMRTAALVALAAVLAVFVIADYWGGGTAQRAPAQARAQSASTAGLLEDVRRMRGAIAAQQSIDTAYAGVALPYAERMAELKTYYTGARAPRDVVLDALREALAQTPGVEIGDVVVGVPQPRVQGVALASATVRLRSGDSQAIAAAVREIGRPSSGLVWREFSLLAAPDAKTVTLTGTLQALLVEAE